MPGVAPLFVRQVEFAGLGIMGILVLKAGDPAVDQTQHDGTGKKDSFAFHCGVARAEDRGEKRVPSG